MAPKKNAKTSYPAKHQTTLKALERNNVDVLGLLPITLMSGVRSHIVAQDIEATKQAAARITAVQAKDANYTQAWARLEAKVTKQSQEYEAVCEKSPQEIAKVFKPLHELLAHNLTRTNDDFTSKLVTANHLNDKLVKELDPVKAWEQKLIAELNAPKQQRSPTRDKAIAHISKIRKTNTDLAAANNELSKQLKTVSASEKGLIAARDELVRDLNATNRSNAELVER